MVLQCTIQSEVGQHIDSVTFYEKIGELNATRGYKVILFSESC